MSGNKIFLSVTVPLTSLFISSVWMDKNYININNPFTFFFPNSLKLDVLNHERETSQSFLFGKRYVFFSTKFTNCSSADVARSLRMCSITSPVWLLIETLGCATGKTVLQECVTILQ